MIGIGSGLCEAGGGRDRYRRTQRVEAGDTIVNDGCSSMCLLLAEGSGALVGLAIAAVGIALSQRVQMSALDGAASMLIGNLVAGVATLPP